MKNVDGYSKDVSIIQRQINNSVSIAEQETNVIFYARRKFCNCIHVRTQLRLPD